MLLKNYNAFLNLDAISLRVCMLAVTRRLLKINNQFGVESSSNLFLAQIILTKHRRFPTRTAKVSIVGCKIR